MPETVAAVAIGVESRSPVSCCCGGSARWGTPGLLPKSTLRAFHTGPSLALSFLGISLSAHAPPPPAAVARFAPPAALHLQEIKV